MNSKEENTNKEIMGTNEEEEEEEVKWVKHYSSNHHILLVGEGDFSFSSCLAQSFGSASNIVATSLDSYDDVVKKYKNGKPNLENLLALGASTFHGVDATKMKLHSDLRMQKFDRIVFNFPHAGFHGKEDNVRLIEKHKKLVLGFFKNACRMLRAFGEVHITHKTSNPFCQWNIEELAWRSCLALVQCVDFKIEDYPGYNNKRGDSTRCDEPFPLGECSTFKFKFSPAIKMKMSKIANNLELTYKWPKFHQDIEIYTHYHPTSLPSGHAQTNFSRGIVEQRPTPLALVAGRSDHFNRHFNHASEIYQRPSTNDVDYFGTQTQGSDYERCTAESSGGFQYYQGNPFKMHQQVSFSHMNCQTGLNKNMKEFPGYMEEPLRISIINRSVNASHRDVDYFANHAQECDYERCTAKVSGRSQYFQGNPFKVEHLPSSYHPMDHQTELYKNMGEYSGYMGPPLTTSMRKESDMDNYANQVQECDYGSYRAKPMLHRPISFSHTYRPIEFNRAPLNIRNVGCFSDRTQGCDYKMCMAEASGQPQHYESCNASQEYFSCALRETRRQQVFLYGQHSEGMYHFERSVADAPEKACLVL